MLISADANACVQRLQSKIPRAGRIYLTLIWLHWSPRTPSKLGREAGAGRAWLLRVVGSAHRHGRRREPPGGRLGAQRHGARCQAGVAEVRRGKELLFISVHVAFVWKLLWIYVSNQSDEILCETVETGSLLGHSLSMVSAAGGS